MPYNERRLPHWNVIGTPLFVTFRLYGSLPPNRIFLPERTTTGKAFVSMDRILDNARTGPLYLREPEIANLVVKAVFDGETRFHRYELHAYVVMANHVHILVTPNVVATQWLGPLKGFTAHEANRILCSSGTPFWQDESYDHLVRSDDEFKRIRRYIENNPVTAGLVTSPEEFRWSSKPPERRPQPALAAPERMLKGRSKGAALLESALLVPILLAFLIGTTELGRMTYTYYMIQKVMADLARYLGTQQGVNFCDNGDPIMVAAINNALTGTPDGSGNPIVTGLTPSMVQVTISRYDPNSQQLTPCDCSASGCDISQGGGPPGFIAVSLANGYTVRPLFWGFSINPFPLIPSVTVPYAGN